MPLTATFLIAASAPVAAPADLAVLGEFFVPALLREVVLGGCGTALQTKWAGSADDRALEAALPGVHAEMGAAALAACARAIDPALAAERERVRRDWARTAVPGEINRLAAALRPVVASRNGLHVPYREGDMARTAVTRLDDRQATAAQDRAASTLAATPGGSALVARVAAYQRQSELQMQDPNGPILAVVRAGLRAAHARANDYARAKGRAMPYPNG